MGLRNDKTAIRRVLLAKRAGLSTVLRVRKSRKILAKLFKTLSYRTACRVAFYYSVASEVGTRTFLTRIMKTKELFLPRVEKKKKRLILCRVRDLTRDLRRGAYAILEPRKCCPDLAASRMDLIVVPGVGFDKRGNRLGRGGGYYDRLLARAKKVPTVGICFREQIFEKIPMTNRDVPVGKVVTD